MADVDVTGQAAATDEECYGQCCGLTCDRPTEERGAGLLLAGRDETVDPLEVTGK